VGTITPVRKTPAPIADRFSSMNDSFSPWHALEDDRPSGGIMRSRLKAYEEAKKIERSEMRARSPGPR
jgi:hypothetical protein